MRLLRKSFPLILIALALLLSAANAVSKDGSEKHETAATVKTDTAQHQEERPISFSSFESSQTELLELIRAIEAQTEAQREGKRAENESLLSPLRIQKGLLIVGILYTIFAALQWGTIRRQAKIASDAITKLERPWIFAELEKVQYFNISGRYLVCAFLRRRNVGRSPAWIIGGVTATKKLSGDESLPKVPNFAEYPAYSGPAPIAQSEELAPWEQRFVLEEEEWIQFALSKLNLVVFGEVKYYDSFNTGDSAQHITRFCIYLAHPMNDPSPDKPVIVTTSNYWYFGGPQDYNAFT